MTLIFEWIPDKNYRNFGDAFTELIAQQLGALGNSYKLDDNRMYYLIGSVIDNQHISDAVSVGKTPIFIGCGWRGEPLDPVWARRARFFGVRGPDTQAELKRHGLDVEVSGDSAYPMLKKLEIDIFDEKHGKLLIPHIGDNSVFALTDASDVGMDEIVLPRVRDSVQTIDLITKIANAEFVLSGAMHACIVAHFYGVPFAPFFGDWNDCPPKWFDWLQSIGVPAEKMKFCEDYAEGKAWYENIVPYL
jgi:hypothetical protein